MYIAICYGNKFIHSFIHSYGIMTNNIPYEAELHFLRVIKFATFHTDMHSVILIIKKFSAS